MVRPTIDEVSAMGNGFYSSISTQANVRFLDAVLIWTGCVPTGSHLIETKDATLKGGATRPLRLGVATQALKPPTPEEPGLTSI